MDVSTMLKTLARETPCPGCGAQRLEFLLRCDLDYGACLYTAHCRACEKTFEIVAGGARRPSEEILSEAVEPCAQCGSTERVMHMHCELETRSCVLTLECPACGTDVPVR